MKPSEVLRQAKELLERDGICRGASTDLSGRYCTVGALRMVAAGSAYGGNVDDVNAHLMLSRCVLVPVSSWHDSSTDAEILAGFDRAIALAESEGR